jgi:hypothetical protein
MASLTGVRWNSHYPAWLWHGCYILMLFAIVGWRSSSICCNFIPTVPDLIDVSVVAGSIRIACSRST